MALLLSDYLKGEGEMIRAIFLSAFLLFLAACSTTSTVHQSHARSAGQVYEYSFANEGGDDHEGVAKLNTVIQTHLRDAGLLATGSAEGKIEVVLKHYYVRSNGARFWAGIMAGRDKIISHIRVVGADGSQAGSFEVETTNTSAWGTTEGLMQKHAEEIVARLK
jgi:hypothetical protein